MPHGDGAHTHGPPGHGFDWRIAVVVAVVAMIFSGHAMTGVIDGLEVLVIWVAVVLGLAVAVTGAIVIVMLKRSKGNYVRSVHGPSERDRMLDENARLKREIDGIRAMRDRPEIRPAEYHLHVDAETARQYVTPRPMFNNFNHAPYDADYTVTTDGYDNPGHEAHREGT